jgi:hypothetical protein
LVIGAWSFRPVVAIWRTLAGFAGSAGGIESSECSSETGSMKSSGYTMFATFEMFAM